MMPLVSDPMPARPAPLWSLGDPGALRSDRLNHHRAYAEHYYAETFSPGRGLERLVELLAEHATAGSWLDLGAGPTTLLWSLAFPGVTSIAANDVDPEALVPRRSPRRRRSQPHDRS